MLNLNKKMKTGEKAQLKIQEMAFMIVALVIFFAIVAIFAVSMWSLKINNAAKIAREEKTITSIINLADSPEFACAASKPNCIDADKVMALMQNSNYQNYWGFASLQILRSRAFGKAQNQLIECEIQNYPDCDIFTFYTAADKGVTDYELKDTFVALCMKAQDRDYVYDKCEIARVLGGVETENSEKKK